MIINTEHPYCCEKCGAPLTVYFYMQHFQKHTLVQGACDTEGCPLRHSHQTAEKVEAAPEERKLILAEIEAQRGILVGDCSNMYPYQKGA